MEFTLSCLLILGFAYGISGQGRRQPKCEQGSCYPATGDLLIGRAQNLSASSTCGQDRPERYCVVSYLEKDTKCFTCDSSQPWRSGFSETSHRIENIVSSFKNRKDRWWQAQNGKKNVYIQLDLEAEFHFTHLIMTFKTFRPKSMLIERSFDFGRTWKVYRYFAQNCDKSFPGVKKRRVNSLSDVICEQKYSAETPSSGGEVIFRVLPPFIPIPDPYTEAVQDLLKLTNLRINFTELHTLGDTLLDTRSEIKEKYYYALYDVTVRGSCSCYGHASRCLPVPGYNRSEEISRSMVHGQCECTHNTKGLNCEMCEDFYHDHPWRPARPNQPNVCKRCNCNNHATKCHFDAAKFTASGEVSGGVCDNCMHNTIGVNCQDCKPFYYQDPMRDIRDPEICQPCDCDTFGSEENGLCEQVTDAIADTVAGRCQCKKFVRGNRCDRCADNYWNLQKENPLGCEACACNPDGTIDDLGCDEETGLCRCKRYVTGKNCDECYPGYYGLSGDNKYGCKSCDCDIGGAVRYTCDHVSGQCECRSNIGGMKCTEVAPGYFYAHLDFYRFEAEYGKGSGNARVYIREPIPDSPSYWTGPGYMKVMEGDTIEIPVKDLPFSTYYDIVIRYDPRMPDIFEDVRVTVVRPEQVDPDGLCGDASPRDDLKRASLPPGARFSIVNPSSCLEKDTTYTVVIDFQAYKVGKQTPEATLLIDSIFLVANTEYIPIYQGPGLPEFMKREFLYNRCDVLQYPSLKNKLPEMCERHTFSISAVLHDGALECSCDVTGSLSVECNPSGGQCECKPHVVGRRCDQCAPGTYGFGPSGCKPCDCHEFGSTDNFCNEQTGQCTCIQNVGARQCDECRVSFWGFPQCRQCQCNGNAETCEQLTGACISCRNNTSGNFCERCENGYYGDPRIGVRIPCRPCMCPGGPESAVQHADTCTYDPRSQEVRCNCLPGYMGTNCDKCMDNYYGDPTQVGGKCDPCVCNNNINPDMPGSCDGSTGECLKCLYHTEGFACEHCSNGYHGNATQQNCARCICNPVGTNDTLGECDRVSGQCPCLPNVVGEHCDQCAPDHWDMASEMGCTDCDCDTLGSTASQCNELDGQCSCIDGRGGPKCADCEDMFYGDPLDQCIPCDCDPQGSAARQCDRRTGQCVCVEGVTGFKCDRCARGTTGSLPNCVPCGECFNNWDAIIQDLKELTHDIVKRANDVSVTGAIKAFDEEFSQMQKNIDEIKQILSSVNFTKVDIQEIQQLLDSVRTNLTENTRTLNQVDEELRHTNARVKKGNSKIARLKQKVESLKVLAMELQKNATNIQIREVGGAFDKIKEAERDSREAQFKVNRTASILDQSAKVRQDTERLLAQREANFNDQLNKNRNDLDRLENDVRQLDGDLAEINGMVCGEKGDPCSSLCGGGGCGMCGGTNCDGAVTIAQTALSIAKRAEDLLKSKTSDATQVLIPKIQEAKHDAMGAKMDAQDAYDEASKARNMTDETKTQVQGLLGRIRDFLIGNNTANPEHIQKIAEEVLSMQIPMNPDKIRELANKINAAVQSLTDIDKILAETADSRKIAEDLKKQAENASADAQDIRNTAQVVRSALDEAKRVQARAAKAIEMAKQDIEDALNDFDAIAQETGTVDSLTRGSLGVLDELKNKLSELIKRYTALKEDTLNSAEAATTEATRLADEAYKKAQSLDSTYNDTAQMVNDKYADTKSAKERAERLKKRADAIYNSTEMKMNELKDVEKKITGNEQRLSKLGEEINRLNERMDEYLSDIRKKAQFYENC